VVGPEQAVVARVQHQGVVELPERAQFVAEVPHRVDRVDRARSHGKGRRADGVDRTTGVRRGFAAE
jgi:hypothetical protein